MAPGVQRSAPGASYVYGQGEDRNETMDRAGGGSRGRGLLGAGAIFGTRAGRRGGVRPARGGGDGLSATGGAGGPRRRAHRPVHRPVAGTRADRPGTGDRPGGGATARGAVREPA